MNAILNEMACASGADQRTADWRLDRAGKITASRFIDAIAMSEGGTYVTGPKKGQPKPIVSLAKRTSYMRELAFERTADIAIHEVNGKSLDWGKDVEGHAQEAYQVQSGNTVRKSPFVLHPKYSFIGCSPDGLVDDDRDGLGGTESKCPFSEEVHIRTWLEGMPEDHMPQVQGCLFVTGRDWWDFISYDPRQAANLRLYVQRVYRDDAYIAHLERSLLQFEVELQGMVKRLLSRAAGLPA